MIPRLRTAWAAHRQRVATENARLAAVDRDITQNARLARLLQDVIDDGGPTVTPAEMVRMGAVYDDVIAEALADDGLAAEVERALMMTPAWSMLLPRAPHEPSARERGWVR